MRHLTDDALHKLAFCPREFVAVQCPVQRMQKLDAQGSKGFLQWHAFGRNFLLVSLERNLPQTEFLAAGFNFFDQCVERLLPFGQIGLVSLSSNSD